jgi:hypothetical protein
MQNCAIVSVTGYGNGGGGRGETFLGDDKSAFDVLEDNADERYQSKQLTMKATVVGDGRPALSFGRLSYISAAKEPFPEVIFGEAGSGPLKAVIPRDRCALEMMEAN